MKFLLAVFFLLGCGNTHAVLFQDDLEYMFETYLRTGRSIEKKIVYESLSGQTIRLWPDQLEEIRDCVDSGNKNCSAGNYDFTIRK